MSKPLLIEIGMEEIPARFIAQAAEQLRSKLAGWLDESRIAYGRMNVYATPRRIAVLAEDVAVKQADISEEVKGPSLKIAKDAEGNWTKAALGFARSQGVTPDQFVVREVGNIEYVFARKSGVGAAVSELLPSAVAELIQSMTFPKNMRWGAHELKFVRPIRWLVVLLGNEVVPVQIAGTVAGRTSRGHRFLGKDVDIAEPGDYVESLRAQHVIVDPQERRTMIVNQIEQLAQDKGWHIAMKDDLLDEVVYLVEYPTALYGSFDPSFLSIPQEVLITSMREHQRYFPVLNAGGELQPYFVTVRNGDSRSIELVAKGNEKVLRARLADAKFFYEEDQKLSIEEALERLEAIVYHEELGTIADKVRRIEKLADELLDLISASPDVRGLTARASRICKFDLVTQMVYEFPELQGVMGEDYARKQGEPEEVARAVNEHYMPRHSGDDVPSSLVGAIVSIADKMDTIAGCFAIGIIPTGSQDPYALRRQAAGVVQILLEYNLPVALGELIDAALRVHAEQRPLKRESAQTAGDVLEFFGLRVKNVLSELKIRYDIADAVLDSGIDHLPSVIRKAAALAEFATSSNKPAVDAWTRVCNLAAKAESLDVQTDLFVEQEEHDLYKKWESVHMLYQEKLAGGEEKEALELLSSLRDEINRYFDKVMVMTEDPALRRARLALLASIANDIRSFADFACLVW